MAEERRCLRCMALIVSPETLRCPNCGAFTRGLEDYGFRLERTSKGMLLRDVQADEVVDIYNRPSSMRTKRDIAKATEAPLEVVKMEIARLFEDDVKGAKVPKRKEPEELPDDAHNKAEEILASGDPLGYVVDVVGLLHAGDEEGIKIEWLSALSSQLTRIKINTWAIGRSGKGKTHLKYSVLQTIPSEFYELFTSASPLSLFYYVRRYGEDALDGLLIYIDEVEASKFALPMLRSLTGQTEITPRHLSVYDAEVLDLKILGARTVWFTSVKTFGSEQIKNRFIHTNPDETIEQDDRVFKLLDRTYRMEVNLPKEPFDVCKAMVRQIVRDTKHLKVKIPFEIDWPFKQRRFLYPIFLAFVKVLAKVHYKVRERMEDGKIIATIEDFEDARDLWKFFERSIAYRVSESALTVLECLADKPEDALTRSELTNYVPLSSRQIANLCDELFSEGLINSRKRSKEGPGRHSWEYWRAKIPSASDIRMVGESSLIPMLRLMEEELDVFTAIRKSDFNLKRRYLLRERHLFFNLKRISEFPLIHDLAKTPTLTEIIANNPDERETSIPEEDRVLCEYEGCEKPSRRQFYRKWFCYEHYSLLREEYERKKEAAL